MVTISLSKKDAEVLYFALAYQDATPDSSKAGIVFHEVVSQLRRYGVGDIDEYSDDS
jgi:hypothetical protein